MFAELALAVALGECAPMRWISAAPDSLDLMKATPVNCLLLEEEQWTLADAAKKRHLVTLGVARNADQAARASKAPVDGVLLEGGFSRMREGAKPVIALPPRRAMRLDSQAPVAGTMQGVWPGIEIEHGGKGAVSTAAPGAIADAAAVGAHWVAALDGTFSRKLLKKDPVTLREWTRIAAHLQVL
ncbi:MAG TPA: hypothetical protein VM120_28055 [Bryobacteraceae bacterium]|nr:hypothetical protein [Bryobacteraceae bacterium]